MTELTERVAWALQIIKTDPRLDKGIQDVELARILGTNKDTLAAYRKQRGLLKAEVLKRLVSHYKFSPSWLFQGIGEPFPGARDKYPEVCGDETSPIQVQPDIPSDDYVFIGRMRGKISAGGGLTPDNTMDMQIAFRRDWIRKKGDPRNMSLIKVAGDSMEPTLLSGDLVLVDHSRTAVASQGGIYAISIDYDIMIKRIDPLYNTGKLKIISDNNHYKDQEVNEDKVKINGQVIWFGREIER